MSKAVSSLILAAAALARLGDAQTSLPLTVPAGVPLRVYLTKRLPKKLGEPVHAKLLEPVYAFDREVLPAGVDISGQVVRLDPVAKMMRAKAILGGDFTPLHRAQVVFTDVTLANGTHMGLNTAETVGLASIYSPPRPKKNSKKPAQDAKNGGVLGTGKSTAQAQINAAINAKTHSIIDLVRAPNRKDRIEEYLWSRVPYHPQWVTNGTRFDAVLGAPLDFGSAVVKTEDLSRLGSQPPPDSIVHARLTTALDSANSSQGDKVEAILSRPLFSPDQKLLLPAGTRLTGKVTVARAARWFHRGGQLRFSFESIDIPAELHPLVASAPVPEFRTVATLKAAEGSGKAEIKVDDEGSVKIVDHKTRFIAPALALLVASRAMDNDEGKAHHIEGSADSNTGGKTLGGISGFGIFGAAAAHISPSVASALGMYGLAWSVYSTIVAPGSEVEFQKNAALDIRFGARPASPVPPAVTKFTGTN
jgi:hypothetical protein